MSYTFEGMANGTAGTTAFTDAPFLLRIEAETDEIFTTALGVSTLNARSARFSILGVGEGLFLNGTSLDHDGGELAFNIPSGITGFYVSSEEVIGVRLASPQTPLFFPRRMDGYIGTTPTSLGDVSLVNIRDVTYTAGPIPEPTGISLIMAAATAMVGTRRRFKKQVP